MFDQDFLFSEFYLSLLFKFKIRPLLVIFPPNAVMLIIIIYYTHNENNVLW